MPNISKITEVKRLTQTLVVNKRKGKISINCLARQGTDIDTKQVLIYVPALELSGYGETFEKALEVLNFLCQ